MNFRTIGLFVASMLLVSAATWIGLRHPNVVQDGLALGRELVGGKPGEDPSGRTASSEVVTRAAARPAPVPTSPQETPARVCKRDEEGAAGRVIGGSDALIENWPGLVALRTTRTGGDGKPESTYFCGGILVHPEWVLTAGHCIIKPPRKTLIAQSADPRSWVNVGKYAGGVLEVVTESDDLLNVPDDVVRQVIDVRLRDNWKDNPRYEAGEDIALLRLESPARGPVARFSGAEGADPKVEDSLWVAGFGLTKNIADGGGFQFLPSADRKSMVRTPATILQELRLPFMDTKTCVDRLGKIAPQSAAQLCAGAARGKDSCSGDSGGPLALEDKNGCPVVVGLVSYGPGYGCALEGKPAVYTRLSSFADWIRTEIAKDSRGTEVALRNMETRRDGVVAVSGLKDVLVAMATPGGGAAGRSLDDDALVEIELVPAGTMRVGDVRRVRVKSLGAEGYVIVFDRDSSGDFTFLAPNADADLDSTYIRPGETKEFGAGPKVSFEAAEPVGPGSVYAVVTKDRTLLRRLADKLEKRDPEGATRGFTVVSNENAGVATSELMEIVRCAATSADCAVAVARYDLVK